MTGMGVSEEAYRGTIEIPAYASTTGTARIFSVGVFQCEIRMKYVPAI